MSCESSISVTYSTGWMLALNCSVLCSFMQALSLGSKTGSRWLFRITNSRSKKIASQVICWVRVIDAKGHYLFYPVNIPYWDMRARWQSLPWKRNRRAWLLSQWNHKWVEDVSLRKLSMFSFRANWSEVLLKGIFGYPLLTLSSMLRTWNHTIPVKFLEEQIPYLKNMRIMIGSCSL